MHISHHKPLYRVAVSDLKDMEEDYPGVTVRQFCFEDIRVYLCPHDGLGHHGIVTLTGRCHG